MSKIEGITPSKKHKTIEQKRGKYRAHNEIRERDASQRRLLAFVIGMSVVVLIVGWVYLLKSGALFTPSNSDSAFVTSLGEGFNNADTFQQNNVDTPQEEQLLNDYNQRTFPDFQD